MTNHISTQIISSEPDNTEKFLEITEHLIGHKITNKWDGTDDDSDISKWRTKGELQKTLKLFLNGGFNFDMGRKEFNQILLLNGISPVDENFFEMVFGGRITSLKHYHESTENFKIKSLLLFGNVKYSFKFFSGVKEESFSKLFGSKYDPELLSKVVHDNLITQLSAHVYSAQHRL